MIIVTSKDSSSITSITIATTYKGTYTLTGGEYAQYPEACYSGGEVTFYIQKNMYDEDNGYPVNGYTNTGEIIDGLYITQDGELYGIAVDADYVYTEWSAVW